MTNLQEQMALHNAVHVEAIVAEGVTKDGFRTYVTRGFHLYSDKGYVTTIMTAVEVGS